MMTHAVETMSGAVPLLPKDTAPSEHEHDEMSVPTVSVFRRDTESATEESFVTPREGRSTDASRLMFTWPMMVAIVGTAISVTGAQYIANAGVRESQASIASDVRDMRTRMEMQTQIDIARTEARSVEVKAQNEAINELRRLTQLLQLQYAALEKQIAAKGR